MEPVEVVRTFHERLAHEKRADWSLWVKKPNLLVAGLIALGKYQKAPSGHTLLSQEGDDAVVAFLGLAADPDLPITIEGGAVYKAFLRRVDGAWRIVRFGD